MVRGGRERRGEERRASGLSEPCSTEGREEEQNGGGRKEGREVKKRILRSNAD